MRNTTQGAETLNRVKRPIFLGVYLHFCITDQNQFALKSISIQTLMKNENKHGSYETLYGEKEEEKLGVSLLHILSEIDEEFRFNESSS